MRLARRVAKFLFWTLLVLAAIVGGAAWFAYALVTDSETAARLIRAHAVRFLPGSALEMGKPNIGLLRGEVKIKDIALKQRIDGEPFVTAKVPWLSLRLDPRQLLHGKVVPREIDVSHPNLRLRRRKDGTWNLQGLLADPLPAVAIENPPPIVIRNGTVELVRDDEGAKAPPAPAAPGDGGVAILRDVMLRVEAAEGGRFHFEGTARGDLFDRLTLEGSIDPATGDVALTGELSGLTLSEHLRRRLPAEARPAFDALALVRGEIDLEVARLAFHPRAPAARRLDYDVLARLHGGVWECPMLPFPINDLSATVAIREGLVTIRHAEGYNGRSTVRAEGSLAVACAGDAPFDLSLEVVNLELDQELREKTPAQFAELWDVFKPRGNVDASLRLVRHEADGPVDVKATVFCRDVAAVYRHFPYPLEHMSGRLDLDNRKLEVDLKCLIGEKPASMKGTIDDPGPDAVVRLDIRAESVPIDAAFMAALPPDVFKVVDRFHPSGSVRARVHVFRQPLVGPEIKPKPEGQLTIDAILDLNPRCEITWADLPYPVRNLTGRLKLHPDLWEFENMRGHNGEEVITGNGRVQKLNEPDLPGGEPPLKIDLRIQAENLPFSEHLRKALQPAWQKTWAIINPTGSCDVDATIHIAPSRPDVTHIVISPRAESAVRLVVPRPPESGSGGGQIGVIELRMEDARGRFEFDNGKVAMKDVTFFFHGAPVRFTSGEVEVEDSGRFALAVNDLWIKDIRFDPGLRNIMPPFMALCAVRLDDGRPFTARGDLRIGWSGVPGEPAWCSWARTRVVFVDNSLKAGIPLEHIQGQLEQVSGWSDGRALEVHGIVRLASVSLMGQQVTELESPFHVERGLARLDDLRGRLLGGELTGKGMISLNDTPKYSTTLALRGAELQEFAKTQRGRQSYRGTLDAALELSGLGVDVRSVQGKGEAHIAQGDLGELPMVLRIAKFLNINLSPMASPRNTGKSAFDSADVAFRVVNGEAILDPIKFTGSAFSLQGRGTRDPLGNLDLRFKVLYGRDQYHVPVISDVVRELSGQLFIVRVAGPSSSPKYELVPLPPVTRMRLRRGERAG
jgi:hypothetical protein